MKYLFFSLRAQQWIKNFFIFLPMIFGGKLLEASVVLKEIAAFLLFSLTASVIYIVNDIIDVEKDRVHPTKRLRPIASGRVTIKQAKILALVLAIVSIPSAFILDITFGWILVVYFVFNFLYSKILKNAVIIDIFCIGFFFLLRIMAGSVIAEVEMSHWIIFMVVLLALFLGFNKRREEIRLLERQAASHREVLKKYSIYFIDQMTAVITSSIVVVYMLYTIDARTVRVFGTNHLIYTIPFVYYGIFRYLYIIHKVVKEGDPTRILLFDKKMQLNILFWVASCIAVIYFGL